MQRLDKYLSEAGAASRKTCRDLLKAGRIAVNGVTASAPEQKIDERQDQITLDGVLVEGFKTVTLLLYKPAGYITATEDPKEPTVMQLLDERYRRLRVVPVGRLDKQTEGLLLFTNDGALNHKIASPRHGTRKVYYAEHAGRASAQDVAAFAAGLQLKDGTLCRPAVLRPLGEGKSEVTVYEGKYHQVRRMMAARGLTVYYLRREQEGALTLQGLQPGQVRELTPQEVASLQSQADSDEETVF